MEGKTFKRVFIAINLPPLAKQAVLDLQRQINDKSLSINWNPIDNLHLTLLFLGNLNDWEIKKLSGLLDDIVDGTRPLGLCLNRISVLKDKRIPRLLYVQAKKSRSLFSLQGRILKAALDNNIGEHDRRQFLAHVTLGRFSNTTYDKKLFKKWSRTKIDISFPVTSIDIMESVINTQPVNYQPIHNSYFSEI